MDRLNDTCLKCGEGTYAESSIHDDMDGLLHCTVCNQEVGRHSDDLDIIFGIKKLVDIEPRIEMVTSEAMTSTPKKLKATWNAEKSGVDIMNQMLKRTEKFEQSKKFRYVGFWYCEEMQEGPNPLDFVDSSFDKAKRAILVEYLENGQDHEQWRGFSGCRICGCLNGTKDLTDGEYVWPEGYAHYVKEHNVLPPPAFVRKILWAAMLKESEEIETNGTL
jgi:hypothetical protein